MGERVLILALIAAIGIVLYKESFAAGGNSKFPPRPSVFVGVALVFTILGVLAVATPGLAAAFAVAFDVGLTIRGGKPQPANLQVIQGGQAASA